MIPSRKTLARLTTEPYKIEQLRRLLEKYDHLQPLNEWSAVGLCKSVSEHLNLHGAESIPAGSNKRSPGIVYANTGDSYGTTIMVVDGKVMVGNWGDLVERGAYA